MKRAVLAAVLLTSCGGPLHQIVEDPRDLSPSSSAPQVTAVTDLGGADVPLRGPLKLEGSDGIATVGETLWVRGKNFGRQPTVYVGGHPTMVLGRTRDGGALVRVPIGTPSGAQPVEVVNDAGRGQKTVMVRRYAATLAPQAGQVAWAEITSDGPVPIGATQVDGGRFLSLSPDGRAAYVGEAAHSAVTVLEIPAAGAPRALQRLDLGPQPVIAMVAAARAPVLVLVRAEDLAMLDLSYPLRPTRTTPRPLPSEVRDAGGLIAVDISLDGRRLAAITARGNQVLMLDLPPRGPVTVVGTLDLIREVREPILIDVAFSPDGLSLWALAGDTTASRLIGPQPTRVFGIRLSAQGPSAVRMDVARTVTIDEAADPIAISAGRPLPLASGSAIRLPPERATVFVSARLRPEAASRAPAVAGATVFRVSAQETALPAAKAAGVFGKVDMSPDGRWLLVAATTSSGGLRLVSAPADARPGPTHSIDLAGGAGGGGTGVARPATLLVQP